MPSPGAVKATPRSERVPRPDVTVRGKVPAIGAKTSPRNQPQCDRRVTIGGNPPARHRRGATLALYSGKTQVKLIFVQKVCLEGCRSMAVGEAQAPSIGSATAVCGRTEIHGP